MELNLVELQRKTGLSQMKLAQVSGISRYAILKAAQEENKETIHVSDDRYRDLCLRFPDALPLPEEYDYYTEITVRLNKVLCYINTRKNINTASIRNLLYWNSAGYLYSKKEQVDKLFPDLYLPCVKTPNNKYILFESAKTIPFDKNMQVVFNVPIKIVYAEDYKGSKNEEEYEKYSAYNIIANMACRNMSKVQFSALLGKKLYIVDNMLSLLDNSFYECREIIDQIFTPYIYPIKKSIYKKNNQSIFKRK